MINKVCTFKFEILPIFKTFSLPSMTTGTTFTFFNLIWRLNEPGEYLFIAKFDVTHETALLCKILKNSMLVPFAYS